MANFRTTADYLDSILLLSGETTSGTSRYETRALHFLNRIYSNVIAGGNEFNIEFDELWSWSMARDPMIIELAPKVTGTMTLTNGSTAITLGSAPSISLAGYHFKLANNPTVYRFASHTAASTSASLEGLYEGTSGSSAFTAFKLDYELVPSTITIDSTNNKIPFTEDGTTQLTSTLTSGSYTPGALCTEIVTQLDTAGANTYATSYSSITRKFTITATPAGTLTFAMLGSTGTETTIYASSFETLGFGLTNHSGGLTYTSERALGAICKFTEPFKIFSNDNCVKEVFGIDKHRFTSDFPIINVTQGIPTRFTVIEERDDGYVKVRFNAYPESATRIEVSYVPVPLNLYDTTTSHPLIPRKYSQVLEYGGAAYLCSEKNDSRAQNYFAMATQSLEAMVRSHRKTEQRVGEYFAQIIARPEQLSRKRKLVYGDY